MLDDTMLDDDMLAGMLNDASPPPPRARTVTSRPIRQPFRIQKPKVDAARYAVGVMALLPGATFWLADARYTTQGWATSITGISAWFGQPVRVVLPTDPRWFFGVLIAVGVLYSLVEFGAHPMRNHRRYRLTWGAAFSFAVATDLLSTVVEVLYPTNATPFEVWLSGNLLLAILWAALIAFLPEALLIGGWRVLRGRDA